MSPLSIFVILLIVCLWTYILYLNTNTNFKWCGSNITIFVILFMFFTFALSMEYMQLFCPSIKYGCDECGDGQSMNILPYKVNPQTTTQEAKSNIKNLLNNSTNSKCVTWRKIFILTAFIILLIAIYKKDLNPIDIFIMFILCFVILQLLDNFYYYHYYRYIEKNIKENLSLL